MQSGNSSAAALFCAGGWQLGFEVQRAAGCLLFGSVFPLVLQLELSGHGLSDSLI